MSAKLMSLIDVHEKEDDMIDNLSANRRDLLIAPLLAAMPAALLGGRADASPVDPAMTFTKVARADHLGESAQPPAEDG
jgi:hypothetical protein